MIDAPRPHHNSALSACESNAPDAPAWDQSPKISVLPLSLLVVFPCRFHPYADNTKANSSVPKRLSECSDRRAECTALHADRNVSEKDGIDVQMAGVVTRFFGLPQEVNSGGGYPARLLRWTLLGKHGFNVSLFHSFGDDWNRSIDSYPGRFFALEFGHSYSQQDWKQEEDRVEWILLIGRNG